MTSPTAAPPGTCGWCHTPLPPRAPGAPGRNREYCAPPQRCSEEARRDRARRRVQARRAAAADTPAATQAFRTLATAAAQIITGIEKILGNGVLPAGTAAHFHRQLAGMRTQLSTLADAFTDADSAGRDQATPLDDDAPPDG